MFGYLPCESFKELGLIRKPASFMTSICDERGQELIYAGMAITEVFKEEMGIGGVLGLLWFQRRSVRLLVAGCQALRIKVTFVFAAFVQVTTLCLPVHRDVSDGDG